METSQFRLRQNLAALLRERGMTAAELSRKTGVAKQVLSDWMAGVQPRKLEQLYVVAQTLEVSLETLCFAISDSELFAGKKSSPPQTNTNGASGIDIPELRGRFEVYLRRISDE